MINNIQFELKFYRPYWLKLWSIRFFIPYFSLLMAFQTNKRTYGWGIATPTMLGPRKFYLKHIGKWPAPWVYRHVFWRFYFMICYKDGINYETSIKNNTA